MSAPVLSEANSDVFGTITAKIASAIEAGAGTFTMPWHGGIVPPTFPINAATEKSYRGINVLSLWVDALKRRYVQGYWASYQQWKNIGAQVRKGERGSVIVFYKKLETPDESDGTDPGEGASARFVARASYVFNAEQVDGWTPPIPKTWSDVTVNEEVAAFIEATGAQIVHGGTKACYRRDLDRIDMPKPELFVGTATSSPTESYHAVLLHEVTHNAESSVMPRRSGFARKSWPDRRFHAA
ncbi:MAG: ArdC-like ssDNA-binding domain-containing protein [Rhizomicrobium sp.]|nr:ArdC-like ssDNA-binding domain-containing protein [Rhizomicrobium sp.]